MGVYIKGVEMPKNCWQCPMVGGYELSDEVKARYSTLYCRLLKCKTPAGVRPEDCPLVPVPPHGDLIDRNALKDAICSRLCIKSMKYLSPAEETIVNEINNAPAIIPASEEGE